MNWIKRRAGCRNLAGHTELRVFKRIILADLPLDPVDTGDADLPAQIFQGLNTSGRC